MSLTSHLKDVTSPVRLFIDETFPALRKLTKEYRQYIGKNFTTIEPIHKNYTLAGTAIDYRFRFIFEVPKLPELIASQSVQRLYIVGNSANNNQAKIFLIFGELGQTLLDDFSQWVNQFHQSGNILEEKLEYELLRYCVCLAQLDEFYRSARIDAQLQAVVQDFLKTNRGKRPQFSDMLEYWKNSISQALLDDLYALSQVVVKQYTMFKIQDQEYNLNPTFGEASEAIGGADADLIIDNCMYDIKTTIKPNRAISSWLKQLFGYLLLDYKNAYNLTRVGIILPRQNIIWEIDVNKAVSLAGAEKDLAQLRAEFKEVLNTL